MMVKIERNLNGVNKLLMETMSSVIKGDVTPEYATAVTEACHVLINLHQEEFDLIKKQAPPGGQ
jgi:hypothetical protein